MKLKTRIALSLGFLVALGSAAQAQIKIGVIMSMTGPAASLGIPQKNTVPLMPQTIDGKDVAYIVLDDASDPTAARRNADRLVNEDKVDLVLGPTISPSSLAIVEVGGRSKTPIISFAAARAIIDPIDENRHWVFKTPYNDSVTAEATANHMKKAGTKTVGVIGFNDAYGESWATEFDKAAKAAGLQIVASEKYNKNDTSVTAQVLKTLAARPDAVLIIAAGTPGVLPQSTLVERGYKGRIYQTTGVTTNDFLRVGGKAVDGTIIATAPLVVAEQLPESHPAKAVAVSFAKKYDAANGQGSVSAFPGYAWDAVLIAQPAISGALKKAQPGTAEFRAALRDLIEATSGVATTAGVVNMSAKDHNGFSPTSLVMTTIKDGRWTYVAE
jgi:branched-chain amino acid transport system substrate-binding protein